ncbi:MAG: hypothetical protein K1X55_17330 [Chitinophagales bacterium]|nr:hypothetical protein [Chitinophagales bacterium]
MKDETWGNSSATDGIFYVDATGGSYSWGWGTDRGGIQGLLGSLQGFNLSGDMAMMGGGNPYDPSKPTPNGFPITRKLNSELNILTQNASLFFNNQAEGYSFLWNNSFNNEMHKGNAVENFGFILSNGILILPTKGTDINGTYYENNYLCAEHSIFPSRNINGSYEIYYQEKWVKVLATIHTHPGPSIGDIYCEKNFSEGDFYLTDNLFKVPGFVLIEDKIYFYLPNTNSQSVILESSLNELLNGSFNLIKELNTLINQIKLQLKTK